MMQPRTNLNPKDNLLINQHRKKPEVVQLHSGVLDKSSSTTLLIRLGLWVAREHFDLYEEFVRDGE